MSESQSAPQLPDDVLERARLEEEYHDDWAKELGMDDVLVRQLFEAPTAIDNEFILERLGDLKGRRLLDLACGVGETAVYFALKGAQVSAVDISQESLNVAENLARSHGVEIATGRMPAEALEFEDESFDIVYGYGALHHIDIAYSAKEIHRVLRTGGVAMFVEPLGYNPTVWFYRFLAKDVRTEMERPFFFSQLRYFKHFSSVAHQEFWFLSLLVYLDFFLIKRYHPSKVRYWRQVLVEGERYKGWMRVLKKLDRILLKFPPLRYLSATTVIMLRK